jgi:MFS family permease
MPTDYGCHCVRTAMTSSLHLLAIDIVCVWMDGWVNRKGEKWNVEVRALDMKSSGQYKNNTRVAKNRFFYGWVIVAACTVIQTVQYGIQYSFGIFFKPMIADFGWSRAATSGAYSVLMISAGASAIPLGLLADRFGPSRVTAICGFAIGLALVLTSRVTELWQLYLTFGVMQGIAIGGTIAITSGVTARWFVRQRGLALGMVSAGIGLGTLVMPPIAERLIAASDWSRACLVIGVGAFIVTVSSAVLLRRDPEEMGMRPYGADAAQQESILDHSETEINPNTENDMTFRAAIRTHQLWMMTIMFFLVNICVQIVMVHLVNYATDLGIAPFTAATIVSVIGIGGLVGRLVMGTVSDKIGSNNALIITSLLLAMSLVWLIFSRQLWMLYVFAVFFSFAYGGEVPQMPLLIGQFFGLRAVMALTGATSAGTRAGGALGSWLGGETFDVTHSYLIAFVITAVAGFLALTTAVMLKKVNTSIRRSS